MFARPTLSDLITRIKGDFRGQVEITGPLLRRAMVDVAATVWAGAIHTAYGYLDWIAKQIFAKTADSDSLLRKAAPYDITPIPATFATGSATATGAPDGTAIPIDTILTLDDATKYRVTTGQVIAGGTATLPITAELAGSGANVPAGTVLAFESPIAGVDSTATVAADITDGVDQEGIEALRARFLLRLRKPPEGGADQDYEAWALAVAGVTRAWTYPNENGKGTVVVRFVEDGNTPIFPDGAAVAAVQAALDAKRPVTAEVTAEAPVELDVAFTIHLVPDNADTRAAVEAELADLLKRVAEPGDGAGRGTVLLSAIRTAIGTAEGVTDYSMTVPAADVVPAVGELAVLGVVTWV